MLIAMSTEPVPQQSSIDDPLIVFVPSDGGRRFDAFGSTTQFKLEYGYEIFAPTASADPG